LLHSGAVLNADVRASGCCRKRNGDAILGVFMHEVNSGERSDLERAVFLPYSDDTCPLCDRSF
jgi:hypothetical protein